MCTTSKASVNKIYKAYEPPSEKIPLAVFSSV